MNNIAPTASEFYTVGGTVHPDSESYIERSADEELYEHVLAGDFCYILTPRQMGKSSLMARTVERLRAESIHVVIVDLSTIGAEKESQNSADRWYYGLAYRILQQLSINVTLRSWWQEREGLPALQKLTEFFCEVVLANVPGRIVLFFDEIDTTIRLPFADDFFAAVRACYNARANDAEYRRLSFVFLGVASPADLMQDKRRTPFNIGHRIELTDFSFEEAYPLAAGLGFGDGQDTQALERILHWTGGHPYLTQKLCRVVSEENGHGCSDQEIDRVVSTLFFEPGASRQEENLNAIRNRLTARNGVTHDLLKTYRRIARGKSIVDDTLSPIHTELKLSGLVVPVTDGSLSIRNSIYERIFTADWAKESLPRDWNRSIAVGVAMLIVGFGFGIWYTQFLPRPYIQALQTASDDYQVAIGAHESLSNIPFYADVADSLLADFWQRRALRAEVAENRDEALLSWLESIHVQDDASRRGKARQLVGADYGGLVSTYRAGGWVQAVAFSPNGEWVVTGSNDGTARVWAAATGQPVSEPLRHDRWVRAVAFSPNGEWVVTGSDDGTARVWAAATGQPVSEPLRHDNSVQAVAFSPNGEWVVTGSIDGTALVWAAATGQPVSEPLRHDNSVQAVAFSPNGEWVVTGSSDGTARVWAAATGQPVSEPLRHDNSVRAVAFSPNGEWVVTGSSDGTARVWAAATGQPVSEPLRHDNSVRAVAFSPNGEWVVTGSSDGTARVWAAATGQPVSEPLRHDDWVRAVAFSPNGEWVVTGSGDRTARVWAAATGQPVSEPLRHDNWVRAVAFSPNGEWVVTGSDDGTARVWVAATGQPVSEPLRHDNWVRAVAFSPNGEWVVTGSSDRTARVWVAATGQPVSEPLRHDSLVLAVAFSPNGEWVVTGSADGTARAWVAATGQPVSEPLRHDDWVRAVAFSPNGEWVVTGSSDRTARVWAAATGQPVSEPLRHDDWVRAVAFSPNGEWVVTGSDDGTARVWVAATGQPVSELLRHDSSVLAVAFSPNGEWVVTGSADGTARVWAAATGQPVSEPLRHDDSVRAVAFSPNGQTVLSSTSRWVHLSSFMNGSLQPKESRLLPARSSDAYLFLDDTGDKLQIALRDNSNDIVIPTLRFNDPDALQLEGNIESLMKEWQDKLALELEDGKFAPKWPPPSPDRQKAAR